MNHTPLDRNRTARGTACGARTAPDAKVVRDDRQVDCTDCLQIIGG